MAVGKMVYLGQKASEMVPLVLTIEHHNFKAKVSY